jgi:hypothetical protein
MPVVENNLGVRQHVYKDQFYNSANSVAILLKHKFRVCGTVGPSRGILEDLEDDAKQLKGGQIFFEQRVIYWSKFGRTSD